MPDWLQIHVSATDEVKDAITNYLFELGSCGCQELENEIFAFFPGQVSKSEIQEKVTAYFNHLKALGFNLATSQLEITDVAEQDWNSEWKKSFKPLRISKKFIVKPTWEKLAPPPDTFVIEMDPKQAFGTGHHATTQIMVQFLEKYLASQKRVLDVGTGTGILAIAARKLNAGDIVAIDMDPVAVEAARENCQINSAASNLLLVIGEVSAFTPSKPFDFILANLNKLVILRSLRLLDDLLNQGGQLILSGILVEEADELKGAFLKFPDLELVEESMKEEWIGFLLKKSI